MGVMGAEQPKCMTEISASETIISRQLRLLSNAGIKDVVITTGYYDELLVQYCKELNIIDNIVFVKNPLYSETNYIYSIYCAREYLDDDIILMHGDLVFEELVLDKMLEFPDSCMKISSTLDLPQKDFKAVLKNGRIEKIGIEFFENAVEAQALYKLKMDDWQIWLNKIISYCENHKRNCYAEKAFNEISDICNIYPLDVQNALCSEIDTQEDLEIVKNKLYEVENRMVYMCFSTDMIHSGHIAIIKKAGELGKLMVGVLSDEAVVSYKKYPLMPYSERKALFESIDGVDKVVEQATLSYKDNIEKFHPAFVVHGDDWRNGIQEDIRKEVISVLESYGGKLIEYPYSDDPKYVELEKRARDELATPDMRRNRLRKLLKMKGIVTAMEAHSGLTGLIVENTIVPEHGGGRQFDAMWISSLCDSTAKGKPDIELVDMTSRFRTIDEICEVTTKPIIFDGDTGGLPEHFAYTVRSLERLGVSMVIIEDKVGLKKNSLFGTEIYQEQDQIENFCNKIMIGKKSQRTPDFMICARIESLILEKGIEDALERADAYVNAGADAIMIHSRKKEPDEIFEFAQKFRKRNLSTPIVVVPTTFNEVTEETLEKMGINIVIYANQLTRTGFPAMQNAAKLILKNHRAKECDDVCMPISDIIRLIPEE